MMRSAQTRTSPLVGDNNKGAQANKHSNQCQLGDDFARSRCRRLTIFTPEGWYVCRHRRHRPSHPVGGDMFTLHPFLTLVANYSGYVLLDLLFVFRCNQALSPLDCEYTCM